MRKLFMILVGISLIALPAVQARAGEIDVLLEKLVEKGVLTPLEAQIVKDETKQDVSKQIAQGTMDTMPSWIQMIKLKGDLRLRYQADERESDNNLRNRARYRLRLGVYADPFKDLSVGLRLASGEDSISTSTNETLGDNFMKDDVWIDLAYAEYHPSDDFKLIGGKFVSKPYLWRTTDLLWDGDINPEGFSVHVGRSVTNTVDVFANAGTWFLDEISSQSTHQTDPFIHYLQAGAKITMDEIYSAKAAAVYYGFNNVQNRTLDQKYDLSNSSLPLLDSYAAKANDFDSIGASVELALTNMEEYEPKLPWGIDRYMAVFGDYIKNISNDADNDTGWMVGAKIGHKKVGKPSTWQMKYMYGQLEENAWPDGYADSDRYGGDSNIRGHEIVWEYALRNNVIIGLDYYKVDRLDRELVASDEEQLFQADLLIKF